MSTAKLLDSIAIRIQLPVDVEIISDLSVHDKHDAGVHAFSEFKCRVQLPRHGSTSQLWRTFWDDFDSCRRVKFDGAFGTIKSNRRLGSTSMTIKSHGGSMVSSHSLNRNLLRVTPSTLSSSILTKSYLTPSPRGGCIYGRTVNAMSATSESTKLTVHCRSMESTPTSGSPGPPPPSTAVRSFPVLQQHSATLSAN